MLAITARHHGVCLECVQPIIPGQRIEKVNGAWEHIRCGTRSPVTECACERCFTVHVGEC